MSLPETAIFEDIYGNVKGTCFINVGWFLQPKSLCCVLLNDLPSVALNRPDIHVVRLYGYSFFVEMILDFRQADRTDVDNFLEKLLEIDDMECHLSNDKFPDTIHTSTQPKENV